MEKLINIRNAFTQSKNPNKFNLGRVLIASSKVESFLVLLINIEIDLKIKSVPLEDLIDFFNSYQKIDLDLPVQGIIKEYMKQLMLFFKDTLCQSAYSFVSDAECINAIEYSTLYQCYGSKISMEANLSNYEEFVDNANETGLLNSFTPYRGSINKDGKIESRIIWLAKHDELIAAIDNHPNKIAASAANDILGLGFSNSSGEDILLYIVFPAESKNRNYKPTFKEGCIFGYPDKYFYFLNSKAIDEGWGKTRSTNAGRYGVCETVSPSIYKITDDFKLGAFGQYYSKNVDLCNMLSQAMVKLKECI